MTAFVITLLVLAVIFLLAVYIIYRICFGEYRERYPEDDLEQHMPKGPAYEVFREAIERGIQRVIDAKEYEVVETVSVDGLTLRGRYYHRKDGAPLVLFFHGYHGNFYRDGNGIYSYSKKNEFNLLLVNQRSQGLSEGKTITFGVMERRDCKSWVEYAVKRFGEDVKIDIFGLSMGAATVMMAADVGLPVNVKGILADCGFSSPKEILCAVADSLRYPSKLLYPLAKLGAKWFGHFDLEEASPITAMKNCKKPIIFVHGEDDTFVPCEMSRQCYEACTSPKVLLTVPGAGHGLGYVVGMKAYFDTLLTFSNENGIVTELNETQNLIF